MPSTMDKYRQGFQLGQSVLGQRRQRALEEQRLGISQDYLSIAQQKLKALMDQPPESPYGKAPWYAEGAEPEFAEDYRDKLTRLVDPQLSQMQQWLAENPGKTVEDYLRATKAITKEFKEPKVPYQVEKTLEEKEKREKEIKVYAKDFRKAWYKRTQEIKADKPKAYPITKEEFWRDWKETLPKGDFRADILAKQVAKQVGINPPSAMGLQTTRKGERKFYGATSYEEVETAVADMPEPKKSEILKQAREFFGVK